jgi:hypothetical protein
MDLELKLGSILRLYMCGFIHQQLLAIWGIFSAPPFYYKEKISYKMNFAYISKRIC